MPETEMLDESTKEQKTWNIVEEHSTGELVNWQQVVVSWPSIKESSLFIRKDGVISMWYHLTQAWNILLHGSSITDYE